MLFLSLSIATVLALVTPLQEKAPPPGVRVPLYPNASCPIMGKPVSTKLYADTDKGRIYVCCKSCIADILDDVDTAYLSAFSVATRLANEVCPLTGAKIEDTSPRVVLQGFEFSVKDAKAAHKATMLSQITLAKLHEPALVDVQNETCPVSGELALPNTIVVVQGAIVRLSSPRHLEAVTQDPAGVLAKARALHEKEERDRRERHRGEHDENDKSDAVETGGR